MLKKLGIVKSKTKGYHVFMDNIEPDFLHNTMRPSEYVNYCWEKYTTSGVSQNNALNGTVFDYCNIVCKRRNTAALSAGKGGFCPERKF